ncbi:MAG: PIN domain-containing protein [Prochlorococcaceae cyanobacterium]
MILLDTNVIAALMRKRPDPAVVRWLDRQPMRTVWLPIVVVYELRCAVAIHPDPGRRGRLDAALDALLEQLIQERVAPLDGVAVQQAALLAAQRQALARPMELRDTLIAGIALARGALLATGNAQAYSGTAIGLIDPFAF